MSEYKLIFLLIWRFQTIFSGRRDRYYILIFLVCFSWILKTRGCNFLEDYNNFSDFIWKPYLSKKKLNFYNVFIVISKILNRVFFFLNTKTAHKW